MGRLLNSPRAPWFLTVTLLGLLLLLAFLQYRWTGDLSRAERDGKAAALRDGLEIITLEFDRQLMSIVLALRPEEDAGPSSDFGWRRWSEVSAYPQLIHGLYLVESPPPSTDSGLGDPGIAQHVDAPQSKGRDGREVLHLDRPDGTWRTVPLPEHLRDLPLPLEDLRRFMRRGPRPEPRNGRRSGPRILNPEIPAIVLPVWEGPPSRRRDSQLGAAFRAHRNLIVELDQAALEGLLAELADQHLSHRDGEIEFALRIIDRDQRLLWSLGSQPSGRRPAVDGQSRLFSLRTLEELALHKDPQLAALLDAGDDSRPEGLEQNRPRNPARRETGTRHSFRSPHRLRTLLGLAGGHRDGHWQLLATHAAGSLDAAVNAARRRNLWISSSICGLLAMSLCLLLISTQRAQRLARQQLEFVAGVTHELMTPLAAMRSAGENLADGVIEEGEQVKRYGRLIDREGRRLSAMVAQILELSGMQSGHHAMTLAPTDIEQVISGALTDCQTELQALDFEVERTESTLPSVLADHDALRRALVNLIQNALKYAPEGRWLGIATSLQNQRVEIEIRDRGPGIDAADLPHLFEPFRRGRRMAASSIPGSGLGLSLVKSIVEAHGGEIMAEHHHDSDGHIQGARFVVRLPSAASIGLEPHRTSETSKV